MGIRKRFPDMPDRIETGLTGKRAPAAMREFVRGPRRAYRKTGLTVITTPTKGGGTQILDW